MALVKKLHGPQVHFAAFKGEGDEVLQGRGSVGGGGKCPVDEGVDRFVLFTHLGRVPCERSHPHQTVDQDFDGGKHVRVLMPRHNAVLSSLVHQSLAVSPAGCHASGPASYSGAGSPFFSW